MCQCCCPALALSCSFWSAPTFEFFGKKIVSPVLACTSSLHLGQVGDFFKKKKLCSFSPAHVCVLLIYFVHFFSKFVFIFCPTGAGLIEPDQAETGQKSFLTLNSPISSPFFLLSSLFHFSLVIPVSPRLQCSYLPVWTQKKEGITQKKKSFSHFFYFFWLQ